LPVVVVVAWVLPIAGDANSAFAQDPPLSTQATASQFPKDGRLELRAAA